MTIFQYAKDILANPEKYRKFLVAFAGPLGVLVVSMAPSGSEGAFVVTSTEWYQVIATFFAPILVFAVPNKK